MTRPDVGIESLDILEIDEGVTLVVDEVDEKTGDLVNVTIFETEGSERVRIISARRGWFVQSGGSGSHISLRLANGVLNDEGGEESGYFGSTVFNTLDLNIPIESRELQQIVKSPRDMSMAELAGNMMDLEIGSKLYNNHIMERHKRIAIPVACVLFVFLGTPFAVTRGRSGRGLGLGIGVVIIFMYYMFLLALEPVGRSGVYHQGSRDIYALPGGISRRSRRRSDQRDRKSLPGAGTTGLSGVSLLPGSFDRQGHHETQLRQKCTTASLG
jgi:lipopolysaccharide export LptBFGC system permease protein LptF